MNNKTVFISVTGRVQGVGFRHFVQQKANENNIIGWVRNTTDGQVEIEASGETENLQTFIDWIKRGPTRSIIKTISVNQIPNERSFANFSIH